MSSKNENVQTENTSASFFKELGQFMIPYKLKYISSVLISIIGVVCELAVFVLAGKLTGIIFDGEADFKKLAPWVIAIVACKVMRILLLNFSTWISHHAAYETLRDVRIAITDKMLKLPLGYFEENGSGRLKTMIADRIEGIEITLAHLLPEMTANLLIPVLLIAMMFFVDWRLALCILIWIFVGLMISGGMMIGYEEKYKGQIEASKTMNQAVVEYVGGIEVIKTFNQSEASYQKYESAVYNHAKYNVDWTKETQVFASFASGVAPYSIFPVLLMGLNFFSKGTIDASTLFFFAIVALGIYAPIVKATGFFDQVAQMGTVAKEIREVLDYQELKRADSECGNKKADIEFSDVSFSYEKGKDKILDGISLKVLEGTMLALVGASGSGKSTIAKLLAGYWDADEGNITIGGKKISEYTQEELNSLIAYVDQETFLFNMSIMDNIRVGKPSATDDEVMKVAERAGCDAFIKALPEGYQTNTGSAGGKLSGGERQRIAIARAMIKNAPIMILDEATASTDPENETSIQEALSKATEGKTLVVVAHRLSTIVSAEQIAYIKDGKVYKIGTHEQLLKDCPEYAEMWELMNDGGAER